MNVLLISTADAKSPRMELFYRMVQSVIESLSALPNDSLSLCILFQNCPRGHLADLRANLPSFVELSAIDESVPLSVARNLLLRPKIAAGTLDIDTIVGFPDDDAWYPPNFFSGVTALFRNQPDLDFWFCRYGSTPQTANWDIQLQTTASRREVIRKSSSNTIFVRGQVAAVIGEFDERLGVGTKLASAEDIDYALRIFSASRRSVVRDEILVGHRDKLPGLRGKYYPGSLFVLARHAHQGGITELLRKLAIGIYLVARGELPFGRYWYALSSAFGAFDWSLIGHVLAPK